MFKSVHGRVQIHLSELRYRGERENKTVNCYIMAPHWNRAPESGAMHNCVESRMHVNSLQHLK